MFKKYEQWIMVGKRKQQPQKVIVDIICILTYTNLKELRNVIIRFPEYVSSIYFYRFPLKKIMNFINTPSDSELIIDLQTAKFMEPSVICDLLSSLKLLYQYKDALVYIMFGTSKRLSSYLGNANFFLHSEGGRLFSTDLVNSIDSNYNSYRAINTDKIGRINIPCGGGSDLPQQVINEISLLLARLFSKPKFEGMRRFGLTDFPTLEIGYLEILENSYEHSNEIDMESCCYYTYQNYQKTGLSFANSDIGIGFYTSLMHKAEGNPNILKVFSLSELRGFQNDLRKKSLAAMIESITLRISSKEREAQLRGFPFIFSSLILPCDGKLMLHCDNILLGIDSSFLQEYYDIEYSQEDKTYWFRGFHREKLRNIVFDAGEQTQLAQNDRLRVFDYIFPGVHMSVQIGGGET